MQVILIFINKLFLAFVSYGINQLKQFKFISCHANQFKESKDLYAF